MGKKKIKQLGSALWRNRIRMELLIRLPSFQDVVASIRRRFGIPEDGFKQLNDFEQWQKRILQKEDGDDRPQTLFNFTKAIEGIGHRFQLPFNFVKDKPEGVRYYVLMSKVIAPAMNWEIEHGQNGGSRDRKQTTRWFSIRTYARLDKREIAHAFKDVVSLQNYYFPPTINVPLRIRRQFGRDIQVYERLIKRAKKPVKKRTYKKDSYLRRLSPQDAKKYEHLHPDAIVVEYDETISREVAKELKIKPAVVRQAITRIKKLQRQLFTEN